MRRRFGVCKYCGDLHEYGAWPHNCREPALDTRSDFPSPMIMNATLGGGDGLINPVDGKRYANRRQFEAEVQAHGCTVVGNDPWTTRKRKPDEITDADVVGDVKKSIEQLNGMSQSERDNMMRSQEVASADEMAAAGL